MPRTRSVIIMSVHYGLLAIAALLGHAAVALAEDAASVTCLTIIDLAAFDEDWEASMKSTQETFDLVMNDVRVTAGVPLVMSTVAQNEITPEGIKKAIKQLDYNNQSTLVIYYHGHGATDRIHGHYLHLKQKQTLLRSEILDACLLHRAPPKLLILVTDCCSASINLGIAPAALPQDRKEIVKNLFLRHSGVIDITAASYDPVKHKGEDAYLIMNGAFFTQSFAQAYFDLNLQQGFDSNRDGVISWQEFLNVTQTHLSGRVNGLRMSNPTEGVGQQNLQAFSLGKWDRSGAQRLKRDTGLEINQKEGSLVVNRVRGGSPATKIVELNGETLQGAQFIQHDRITRVNGRAVNSVAAFEAVLEEAPSKAFVRIQGADANNGTFVPYSAFIQLKE